MYRHGKRGSRVYNAWRSMKKRCLVPTTASYPHYGGRGIEICQRWMSFENFYADMGDPPDGLSLDRIDVNGDYEPSNCRWATEVEQQRNRTINIPITYQGETKCLGEWCELFGLDYQLTWQRIFDLQWSPERAFTVRSPRAYNALIEWRGAAKSLVDWCRDLNLDYTRTRQRIHVSRWPLDRVFTTSTDKPFTGAR